jgi:hypothetical protein
LQYLRGLTGLSRLRLSDCDKITPAGLAALRELSNLQYLNISSWGWGASLGAHFTPAGTSFTKASINEGLAALDVPGRLTTLDLTVCEVTDTGLAHVGSVTSLTDLRLTGVKLTNNGMQALGSLTNLRSLFLENLPAITDAGIAKLRILSKLESLEIQAPATDAWLARVAEIVSLRSLRLQGAGLSDTGVLALRGLKKLEVLKLSGLKRDRVTQSGLTALQNALPECEIELSWA